MADNRHLEEDRRLRLADMVTEVRVALGRCELLDSRIVGRSGTTIVAAGGIGIALARPIGAHEPPRERVVVRVETEAGRD